MLLSATPNPPLNVPLTKDADMFMATGTSPNRTTTNYRAPSYPGARVCWIKTIGATNILRPEENLYIRIIAHTTLVGIEEWRDSAI